MEVNKGGSGLPNQAEFLEVEAGPQAPEAPGPGPIEWFRANLVYFLILGAMVVMIYTNFGIPGLVKACMVGLGLGLVIFIHELGHFLAAKWCGVQVRVFSIGFGPALPGCSVTFGETRYLIGALPLGGFVQMLGEGSENGETEDGEDSPRSFKKKTVGQRMMIMSAGVIMNILLGMLCFIIVFRAHGVHRVVGSIWRTDAGSPAWEADIPTGSRIKQIGSLANPSFEDVKIETILTKGGSSIPFLIESPDGATPKEISLEPRLGPGDSLRSLGFSPPLSLKFRPKPPENIRVKLWREGSPAQFAREIPFVQGDVLIAWKTGENEWKKVAPGRAGWRELTNAFASWPDQNIACKVKDAKDKERDEVLAPIGVNWGERIVATTQSAPGEPSDDILKMAPVQSNANEDGFYTFRERCQIQAKEAMVLEVINDEGIARKLLVGPALPWDAGMTMRMGPVTALRPGSPAAKADLRKGDIIARVRILQGTKTVEDNNPPDPMRLPEQIRNRAGTDMAIELTILRQDKTAREPARVVIGPIPLPTPGLFTEETSFRPYSPLPVLGLGFGYQVLGTVGTVSPGGPADKAGIKPGDVIEAVRLALRKNDQGEVEYGKNWLVLSTLRQDGRKEFDQWAYVGTAMDELEIPKVQVRLRRGETQIPDEATEKANGPITLSLVADPSRSFMERGFLFPSDSRLMKADSLVGALHMGWRETYSMVVLIYRNLARMVSRDLPMDGLGGPIEIAAQTFAAAEDIYTFLLMIGMISINLAVVNFLPIPPLDGGHMVFLAYEGARGKPAPRLLVDIVTGTGFGMILLLFAFVIINDLKRRFM